MMKIKMKSSAAGPAGAFLTGNVYTAPGDLSVDQANQFLNAGAAEAVKESAEAAVRSAPETATKPSAKPTKRPKGGKSDEKA